MRKLQVFTVLLLIVWVMVPALSAHGLSRSDKKELRWLNELLEGYPVPMGFPLHLQEEKLSESGQRHIIFQRNVSQIALEMLRGRFEAARELIRETQEMEGYPARVDLLEVDLLEKQSKNQEALQKCVEVVVRHPDFVEAYLKLAELHEKTGDLEGAIQALRDGRKIAPRQVDFLREMHQLYSGKFRDAKTADQRAEALAAIEKICKELVEIRPGRPSAPYLRILAFIAMEKGDQMQAVKYLKKLVQIQPRVMDHYLQLVRFQKAGPIVIVDDIYETFRKALKVDPNETALIQEMTTFFAGREDKAGMLELLRELAEEYPGREDLQMRYALTLIGMDQAEKARAVLEASLDHHPGHLEGRVLLAQLYGQAGEKEKARGALENYLRYAGENLESRKKVISLLVSFQMLREAMERLETAMEDYPRDGELEKMYLELAAQELTAEEKLAFVQKALKKNPGRAYLYAYLVESLQELDRLEDSTSYLIEGLNKVPAENKGALQDLLLAILQNMGQPEEAMEIVEDLWEENPENWRMALSLARLYAVNQKQEDFAELTEQIETRFNESAAALHELALLFWDRNEMNRVEMLLNKTLEADPDYTEGLNAMGYFLAETNGDLDRAQELIQRALKVEPEAGHILDSMGWVLYKKGEHQKALGFLEKAVELEEQDAVVLEHLGDVYLKLERKEDARKAYQEALTKNPLPAQKARLNKKLEAL